ncbi:peptide chain release factor N(5)-glutamine methyltransferase [Mangrovibrevibacter kandeliae]|uniref:peptide chain release factor N(5)-glutamine methyltransferase n=1 Tax=Mangrovibrevibacter kandeliae TaxID=2968473 RepID=UPI002118EB45|nr:peptide chain release factor N(5)-glutamine methyltransferase [Aurantimonas sp. CSK15Z-1]
MTASEPVTLAALLAAARRRLEAAGSPTADLDARLLLAAALGLQRSDFILKAQDGVSTAHAARADALVARRAGGEPVHRILGRRAFYDHDFQLSPETLEPRPDTEALVELARRPMAETLAATGRCRFVDLGTGTGAIAVSLLALFPEAEAVAVDLAIGAVVTARQNAEAAGVAARFHAVVGDYASMIGARLDLVVSNPPYIETEAIERLAPEVRAHDPRLALDGGADGLDAYRAIAADAPRVLNPAGSVLLEIGAGQAADVEAIFHRRGFAIIDRAFDLAGHVRALWLRSGKLA